MALHHIQRKRKRDSYKLRILKVKCILRIRNYILAFVIFRINVIINYAKNHFILLRTNITRHDSNCLNIVPSNNLDLCVNSFFSRSKQLIMSKIAALYSN